MPDKLQVYISILAALVCVAVNIIVKATFFEMTTRMIGVIVLFYILGSIVKIYLRKAVFPEPDEPEETEDKSDEDEDELESL